jgi:hypothetical protein
MISANDNKQITPENMALLIDENIHLAKQNLNQKEEINYLKQNCEVLEKKLN